MDRRVNLEHFDPPPRRTFATSMLQALVSGGDHVRARTSVQEIGGKGWGVARVGTGQLMTPQNYFRPNFRMAHSSASKCHPIKPIRNFYKKMEESFIKSLVFENSRPTEAAQHPDPCAATAPAAQTSPSSPRARRSGAANSVDARRTSTVDLGGETEALPTGTRVSKTKPAATQKIGFLVPSRGLGAPGPPEPGKSPPGLASPRPRHAQPQRPGAQSAYWGTAAPGTALGGKFKGGWSVGRYGFGRARALSHLCAKPPLTCLALE